MTFGQQPQPNPNYEPQGNNTLNTGYGAPQYQYAGQQNAGYNQYTQQMPPQYGQPQYGQPQYAYAGQGGAAATVNGQVAYSYEQAERVSVTKAYGEMTIGLVVTALVAVLAQITGAYYTFLATTGYIGLIGLCVVQVGMAIVLGMRITKMSVGAARAMFYVYAALMGFTLSSIFWVYDLGQIGIALGVTAAFFLALTMFSLTTKFDMLKFGPILMVALVVLIITQLVLAFIPGVSGMTRIVCAIGLIIFAGMTMYDAQSTRALFKAYEAQGPEMIRKISILCALNLYLDFVNMFLYILQLFGSRD
ncbi:Bax inhibitor-1/YccA family protein [Bifidobacterium stellenboschense]|uniref:Integral membrane protein, interacts with FtsH n=1 Tax=Bifidobacterium stellenboschense TaxID=762211 RepID=A0A087DEJ8_9BIFI|nr:Bax inhibitor-1/YccA family protein [Bifidobacterium stellenboschense]KFI93948.1 Integral membrane protein, interacts with FtsH [Bifidobacterium stellenboschense]